MGKVLGFFKGVTASRRGALLGLTFALCLATLLASQVPTLACHAVRNWSTGADLAKLKPGEVVVKAKLLESFKDEERYPYAIMGIAYGMIYYLQIVEVVGGANAARADLAGLRDAKLYVRLNPSICEAYFPLNFGKDVAKTLVLKKGATGLYELVGGQE